MLALGALGLTLIDYKAEITFSPLNHDALELDSLTAYEMWISYWQADGARFFLTSNFLNIPGDV